MADELVVQEWVWDGSGLSADSWACACIEHNVVVTTLNERTAQLAAMTAERDALAERNIRLHDEFVRINSRETTQLDAATAQLAAMTAERDAQQELTLTVHDSFEFELKKRLELEAQLTTCEVHSDNLAKSTEKAIAERDALVTLVEEINGRAQPQQKINWAREALRDIRALCQRELNRG